jgi:hypothetical protein
MPTVRIRHSPPWPDEGTEVSTDYNKANRASTRKTDADHGIDVDEPGIGVTTAPGMYQLIRQQNLVVDRRFEIEFLDPAIAAVSFLRVTRNFPSRLQIGKIIIQVRVGEAACL